MRRAVSVSLGSPRRDKQVVVELNGVEISVERIGTGGDARQARRLFAGLDGQVDALSVGGIDLYVRLDGRDYPVRSALPLVREVRQTPLVDGRLLKYVLERRVFELARPVLDEIPHFGRAFQPFTVDRTGLAEAVSTVITTSPRWQGRSFGINMMEAVLVAYAGRGRALTPQELGALVDEVQLKPEVICF